ncbi:TPA: dTDP-4-dehydrorhamnose 3,5-epimerase [Enterobacter cloacae]|uniref:dTDP-4-dehydrorhamnose 3,5-epimerase n=1 Tax=Enterobacter cloacae TaxID=550 RepID=UPI001DD74A14|nr:dTDP-4-dehydrorhamnose 3,5-epimerase [Enterobacter cloacae]MCK6718073.1 dTDP-4-dehydrorhamnose 3,5-epimerase [Enterobacter cloacae]MEA5222686.1 dTDP-4-dehydrorhamnose 3,5-epimerase [Enterobacter cloacae]CAF3173143.1 dTDP-4-dehydrorhamnose 3%2C5-epimerase [Enterobacter cloacae]CAH5655747.1 dTDP-4-dehydrorhamnose 3%2C5-epimerase [Enterobacter cloacae]HBN5340571.1 dTDP-4-dehydrorhamnose 3,5-epimerase [Enterobacter cloacae]
MKVINTKLDGVLIIEPRIFGDERGFFYETFHAQRYKEFGIKENFVQDNRSRSTGGVLRGLHFQKRKPQGKLVTVTQGEVFDVAVDLRPNSSTFGKYESIVLTGENKIQFYIPPGFAHGFCVLSDSADFQYKCTDFYDPSDEGGLIWNDKTVDINWPIEEPKLSDKDKILPSLEQIAKNLKEGW